MGMSRKGFILGGIFIVAALAGTAAHAQAVTTYSYNGSNRLIQAISSAGTGVQYQYDAAGNPTAVNALTPQALNPASTDTVTMSTPGEAQLLSFTIVGGQPVMLAVSALMTSPAGSSVAVNISNSSGAVVVSFTAPAGTSVDLSSLPPGTYFAVVVPAAGATGSLQLAYQGGGNSGGNAGSADGPLPLWAPVVLGLALIGMGWRADPRRRV